MNTDKPRSKAWFTPVLKRFEKAALPGRQTPTAGSTHLAVPLRLRLTLVLHWCLGSSGTTANMIIVYTTEFELKDTSEMGKQLHIWSDILWSKHWTLTRVQQKDIRGTPWYLLIWIKVYLWSTGDIVRSPPNISWRSNLSKQTRIVDDKIKYSIIEHFLFVKLKSMQYAHDSPARGFLIILMGSLEVLRQIESLSLRARSHVCKLHDIINHQHACVISRSSTFAETLKLWQDTFRVHYSII